MRWLRATSDRLIIEGAHLDTIKTTRHFFVEEAAKKAGIKFQAAEIHGVTVQPEIPELELFKETMFKSLAGMDIGQNRTIQGFRDLFTNLGIKGFAASPELLHQLLKKHGRLPKINSVVDAYNVKSLESAL